MARARKSEPVPRTGPMVFVVQGRGCDEYGTEHDVMDRAFTVRASAEDRRRELDCAARAHVNPFATGSPEKLSSDYGARFWEALTALNFSPPDKGQEWGMWWEALCAGTTIGQRDALWDALDNLHYFDVVEVPLED